MAYPDTSVTGERSGRTKMIAILLPILIPLFYLGIATQIARYVSRTTRADSEDDRFTHAILIGVFWPLTFPFYLALHESPETHYYREMDKRDERINRERMTHRSLTSGSD